MTRPATGRNWRTVKGGVITSTYDNVGRLGTVQFRRQQRHSAAFDTTYTVNDQISAITRYKRPGGQRQSRKKQTTRMTLASV